MMNVGKNGPIVENETPKELTVMQDHKFERNVIAKD
jgi:hypothetical protein